MKLEHFPVSIGFNPEMSPIHIEFDRRFGHFSMRNVHYHDACEIYYLFSGERNYFINDRIYAVYPGDLVFIDSNQIHKTTDGSVPDHERIVVYYEKTFFETYTAEEKQLLLSPFSKQYPVLRLNLQERTQVETLLLSLLEELATKPIGYALQVRHLAAALLLIVARYIRRQDTAVPHELSPVQQKITDIIRHINSHFDESLSLEHLSKQFFISTSYLSRMFKKETGFGFTEYINLTRIKEACRLLRDTHLGVTEISELTGFDNFSHFGRVFKKIAGMPPRTYRLMHRVN